MKNPKTQWYIDRRNNNREILGSFQKKQKNESKKNQIEYIFKTPNIEIKMQHYIHANVFALHKDETISAIDSRRGYSIIKKWYGNPQALSIEGNIHEIAIDNVFACGGKILL